MSYIVDRLNRKAQTVAPTRRVAHAGQELLNKNVYQPQGQAVIARAAPRTGGAEPNPNKPVTGGTEPNPGYTHTAVQKERHQQALANQVAVKKYWQKVWRWIAAKTTQPR